jgi:DNA-binding FrmR family transcriptional regulator
MTVLQNTLDALRKMLLLDQRVTDVATQLKALAEAYSDLDRRLARLEGKFELLESLGATRSKRLPPRS